METYSGILASKTWLWSFDFMLKPIFATAASKKLAQKWYENEH